MAGSDNSERITGFTPEQMVLMADEVCSAHGGQIVDFAALAACAAVTTATIDGVAVHRSARAAAASLKRTILALRPLEPHQHNEILAGVAATVLLRREEQL